MKRLLLFALPFVLLLGCKQEPVHRDWGAMSSNFATTLRDPLPGAVPAEAALDSIVEDSRRWDSAFSDYSMQSGLVALRGRKGDTILISPEVAAILLEALRIGRLSGGRFDIGMHDIKALWNLASENPRVPPGDSLASVLAQRWRGPVPAADSFQPPLAILPDHRAVLLTDSLPIDLGGIAKGYVVDRISDHLAAMGWPIHLIQAGGEIRCRGSKGKPWAIGVKNPRRTDTVAGVIHLDTGMAVSTSGDYERFFLDKGIRYHHILDPRRGIPGNEGSVSTTVLCAKSMTCDAFSTAFFLMGPRRGRSVAKAQGVEVLWIRESTHGLCGIATGGWGARLDRSGLPGCPDEW